MGAQIEKVVDLYGVKRTVGGSPVAIEHADHTRILGAWFDGVSWHRAVWNADGSYGLKEVPDWLKGRDSDKCGIYALTQEGKRALDLDISDYTQTAA